MSVGKGSADTQGAADCGVRTLSIASKRIQGCSFAVSKERKTFLP
jgi:hypothetical protein